MGEPYFHRRIGVAGLNEVESGGGVVAQPGPKVGRAHMHVLQAFRRQRAIDEFPKERQQGHALGQIDLDQSAIDEIGQRFLALRPGIPRRVGAKHRQHSHQVPLGRVQPPPQTTEERLRRRRARQSQQVIGLFAAVAECGVEFQQARIAARELVHLVQ